MSNEAGKSPTVFISYSHKDEDWKDRLVTHLGVLREQGLLDLWDDRQIGAGEEWEQKINDAMSSASVAILLVSPDSLTSKFILRQEVSRLLQRREQEGLLIYPVIVKSCAWQKVPWLSRMQVRPRDGKPLASFRGDRRDQAMSNIATEIFDQLNVSSPSPHQPTPERLPRNRIEIKRLPITGKDLFGREQELKLIDDAWAGNKINVLSLVAWGGVGKSALVNHWLSKMALDDYRSAKRVYGWSFYSQGTTDRAVSADQFIEAALTWFGDKDPNKGSPWDKGERLAGLVGEQRALLVLDGLEPLQHPPGPDEGRLKDQALQALLRQLAARNEGLCLISTRVAVTDFSSFEGGTVARVDLEHLSPEAGAEVLGALGVKGAQTELEQASREFAGHSLALTLLGSYLSDVFGGDVSRRAEVSGLEGDVRHGGHAQKVMTSYEKWFGEGPELSVLRVLGLFNRPADREAVDALRSAPAIHGLTDSLQGLSETNWQRVLSKLRRARLLTSANPTQPGTLDTHPLVREHFGHQLKHDQPDAWREGNDRLYEHLKNRTKEFPDTVEELAPLYAAITHGCEAGRHQEALDEVYYGRICRGKEFFSTNKLGAFGADLAALVSFFDPPWQNPVPNLTDADQAFILGQAGFRLRALGRLAEAVQPLQAGLESIISMADWRNAATAAGNLSEIYLTLGDLRQAMAYAEQSRKLADTSGDSFRRIVSEAKLANALSQAGQLSEAEAAFREAELMQQGWQPQSPLLNSLGSFLYCDLLLEQGKYQEVESRAAQTLQVARQNLLLLIIALDLLSLGRAHLLRAREGKAGDYVQATDYLNQAVDGLRLAGHLEFLSRGLLARAELNVVKGDFSRAQADLDEALSITVRGGMRLHEADCHLGYARLHVAQGEKEKARESWAKAKEMIERMGYGRRKKDVEEIGRQLEEMAGE